MTNTEHLSVLKFSFEIKFCLSMLNWMDYPRFRPSYSCRPYSCPPYSCRDRFMSKMTDSCLALFMSKPFHAQKGLIHVWPYSCPTLFMPRRPIHVRPCSCPTPFMPRRPIHVRPYSCPTPFMSKRSRGEKSERQLNSCHETSAVHWRDLTRSVVGTDFSSQDSDELRRAQARFLTVATSGLAVLLLLIAIQ